MSILKDLSQMVRTGVITQETADNIESYYRSRTDEGQNRQLTVFAILGAILTGLGIILIIAHNWDELSRSTRTMFAFLPLILSQLVCFYVIKDKFGNSAWRESAATFVFFSIGAVISLIGQIYNMPGNLNAFLLAWMLLALPLIYIMQTSAVSLLYLIGITFYGANAGYWTYPSPVNYYWLLLLAVVPYYYFLYKKNQNGNFTVFHDWLLPASVAIVLGSLAANKEEVMFIAYMSLFGIYFLIGNMPLFQRQGSSTYTLFGAVGTVCILLALTFDTFWNALQKENFSNLLASPEFAISAALTIACLVLLYRQKKNVPILDWQPTEVMFLLFIAVFIIGSFSGIAILFTNLMVFAIGVLTIRKGIKLDHLGILNYGLLILSALILCRFFDTDMSFIARGILFITVGAGFFAANAYLIKKRKENG